MDDSIVVLRGRISVSEHVDNKTIVTIIWQNRSSESLTECRALVTDDDQNPPTVQDVGFGRIRSGSSKTRQTNLPTGFEKLAITYKDASGELRTGVALGSNATRAEIEITD